MYRIYRLSTQGNLTHLKPINGPDGNQLYLNVDCPARGMVVELVVRGKGIPTLPLDVAYAEQDYEYCRFRVLDFGSTFCTARGGDRLSIRYHWIILVEESDPECLNLRAGYPAERLHLNAMLKNRIEGE